MRNYILIALLGIVLFACKTSEDEKVVIYSIGDSTMANKKENVYPETGWGQVLPEFFDTMVVVDNHAVNGRSSRSFIGEGRWETVLNKLEPGNFVLIQFGHNDQKYKSPDRYTNPYVGYRDNLKRYINETRSKGAIPVLLTSIVRRNFNEHGTLIDTHHEYPEVVRTVAKEMNVLMIDLQIFSEKLVIELGEEESRSLFMNFDGGEYENYPDGRTDNTHLRPKGAKIIASEVVDRLSEFYPIIAKHKK